MLIPLLSLTVGLFPSELVGARLMHFAPADEVVSKIFLSTPGTPSVVVITSTPLENGEVYHVVQLHEALWSIAIAYNTTIEDLKFLNGLSTDEIFEGQKLLVLKPEPNTATPTTIITATFGIPTSTATPPVVPTVTSTATPLPIPPSSRQSGEMILGVIVLVALLAAGIGSWLGKKKSD